MENTNEFKLIQGVFTPDEGKEIVMNAFIQKINFHQNKNFSSIERFGSEDVNAIKRIPELKISMDTFLELIETAKQSNQMLEITSDVIIKLY